MYSERSLGIMLKPPWAQAQAISALPHADSRRSVGLPHMTILRLLYLIGEIPVAFLAGVSKLLDTFRMQPFDVLFDKVRRNGKNIELVSSRPLVEAITLRQLLIDHLIHRAGLPLEAPSKLRPHVTLHYNRPGKSFTDSIDPIQWRVDEILLIESVIGQTRHITHGRWPLLRGDGSASEYGLPLFRT